MTKQRYGRPSTGQKGNNRPTVVISRENYDEVDNLSLGTGMGRSAIIDYFISEGLKCVIEMISLPSADGVE